MLRLMTVALCLLTGVAAMGQYPSDKYAGLWKKVDSLIAQKGLTASARTETEKIFALAKKEKNDAQMIKSLIYLIRLDETLEEDNDHGLKKLQEELKTAKAPIKQLLHSIMAMKYQDVLDANRYKLYDRTPVAGQTNEDPTTWSLDALHERITRHYKASLAQPELLQKTRLEPYNAIIEKGNQRQLRPTLYDMLAFQALAYFANGERDIKKPAYHFTITQPGAFAAAGEFSNMRFRSSDSNSVSFLALQTYKQLLAFHLNDKDPSALIDADLSRLAFMADASVQPDKNDLYLAALERIQQKYPAHPYGALAGVIALEKKHQRANQYTKGISTDTLRYALVDIRKTAASLVGKFPRSEADARARNLLATIDAKYISAKTELVVIPQKPILSLVTYRNTDAFHYRVVAVDQDPENRRDQKKYWQFLVGLKPIQKGKQLLPDPNDFREHSVEMAIDGLAPGNYALLASIKEDFSTDGNDMTIQYFHVSSISYINRGDHYFLLHRESGQPLPGAELKVLEYRFNQQSGRSEYKEVAIKTTNGDGYVNLDQPEKTMQFSLDIRWAGERLFTKRNAYYYRYNQEYDQDLRELTALFTDRSIYRPGQVVYFKGIKMQRQKDGNKNSVIAGRKTTLRLHDANGQKRDSLVLTTNQFGSYHGQFRIPANLLTGNFSIIDEDGFAAISFQVEEYKRPTFETVFDTVKGQLRLGNDITATGSVKGYAGNILNGATVKYRVVRRTSLPWIWGRSVWPPFSEEMEIAEGETLSDEHGQFHIRFKAIPDLSVDRSISPQFNFEITADATDNSGETRTATKNLSIGYQALTLNLELDKDAYHADSLKEIRAHAVNAEGIPQKINIRASIVELDGTGRLLKDRLWETPDTSVMNRDDFVQLFPNDPYMNEADPRTWKKKAVVAMKNGTTDQSLALDHKLSPGYYLVEVSATDMFGQEVRDKRYIRITNHTNDPRQPRYISVAEGNKSAQPGTTISTMLGSSAENVFLIRQINKNVSDTSLPYKVEQISHEVKTISLPVAESDRGGFELVHLFVKHNRFYQVSQQIDVPWTNKQLDLSMETWRDKLLPGSTETWKVRIKGPKGEKIAAELLTSMYDASLDQFYPHQWYFPDVFRKYQSRPWTSSSNFAVANAEPYRSEIRYQQIPLKTYDAFIWKPAVIRRDEFRMYAAPIVSAQADGMMDEKLQAKQPGLVTDSTSQPAKAGAEPQYNLANLRRNFNETAFFFPDLHTDEQGDISLTFTVPESLTTWKWQMLVHTADLASAMVHREVVTQKDLMIQPNLPRFLREGDKIRLSAKVTNLTDQEITGQARLELIDPETNQPVDGWFQNIFPTQYFTAEPRQTTPVGFEIQVPVNYNKALQYRIVATSGQQTDGEENMLPVLSNRMLVTESKPLLVKGNGSKDFKLTGLVNAATSSTITHHRITVEYSTNPAWYAVLALPYIMEGTQDCSEQLFNRFYANALAALTAKSSPAIRSMIDKWRSSDTSVFISNLLKNPELRSVLMEQTPWVLQARSETEQRKNIALLFDLAKLSSDLTSNLNKLMAMQLGNGSFPWFKGGMADRYITQYILTGIGKLDHLKAIPAGSRALADQLVANGLRFLDAKIREDYDQLVKNKADLSKDNLAPIQVQYLYMRSFFKVPLPPSSQKAYDYFYNQAYRFRVGKGLMSQAMITLVMNRAKNKATASDILKSLKENAIVSDEMGMYWKSNSAGYYWYQSPIETQALLIEAFREAGGTRDDIEQMKLWLLNQKRVQQWSSSKATADAVYALLTSGTDLSGPTPAVTISLGSKEISSLAEKQEAGTGYFTRILGAKEIVPDMGNIKVDVNGNNSGAISWGAVHWQYFEELDNVKAASTPVQLRRQFFIQKNSDKGPVLVSVSEGEPLKVGDRLVIRMTLKADRDMEYMHLKDMRASGTEPLEVISEYHWKGGLGYYQSTRDTGTEFFFSWLPKGTWVFDYPVVVTHTGQFAAGISTLQSMYAPEFNAHSAGVRMEVRE